MTWRHEAHAMLDEYFAARDEARPYSDAMAAIRAERYRIAEDSSGCASELSKSCGAVMHVGRT